MAGLVEGLETRRLLSFVHFNNGHGGTVKIMGNNGNDTLDISVNGSLLEVTLNGETREFNISSVNRIDAKLKKGSDNINIDDAVLIDAWLDGGQGDDIIKAGGGDDHIKGGGGVNMLTGGPGSDRFFTTSADTVTDFNAIEGDIMQPVPEEGGPGVLLITGTDQADTLSILVNASNAAQIDVTLNGILTTYNLADFTKIEIRMLAGADVASVDSKILLPVEMHGDEGSDELTGGGGDDEIDGGVGLDQMTGQGGADHFINEANDDITDFNSGEGDTRDVDPSSPPGSEPIEVLFDGTSGDDLVSIKLNDINPALLDVTINSVLTQYDLVNVTGIKLNGGLGSDTFSIDAAVIKNATLTGGAGNDELGGGGGNDEIDGGSEDDQMSGGPGADAFKNVEATDTLVDFNAGQGDTKTDAGTGGPTGEEIVVNGTSGDDIIWLLIDEGDSTRYQLIVNDVSTFFTRANVTKIEIDGGLGDDTIQMDLLIPQAAKLNGGGGKDFVAGAAGNDTIDGGTEDDNMYGNGGADQFLNVELGDQLTDFNVNEGDTFTTAPAATVSSSLASDAVATDSTATVRVEDPSDDLVRRIHG